MRIVRVLFVAAVMCCGLMGCGPKDAGDKGTDGNSSAGAAPEKSNEAANSEGMDSADEADGDAMH